MSDIKPFAVVKTSGKQLKVSPGDKVVINRMVGEIGSSVKLDQVLAVSAGGDGEIKIGTPLVTGASVTAKILSHTRGDKVIIFKKRRRKGYQKTQGHRQELTTLAIEAIA